MHDARRGKGGSRLIRGSTSALVSVILAIVAVSARPSTTSFSLDQSRAPKPGCVQHRPGKMAVSNPSFCCCLVLACSGPSSSLPMGTQCAEILLLGAVLGWRTGAWLGGMQG